MISGATVTVKRPGEPSTDRLGNVVPGKPTTETVDDVLIAAPTVDDMEAARANGVTLAYTLHFPKPYARSLRGCTVVLPEPWDNGKGYRVVGDPRPYMDANTPTRWHMPVNVEAADG